MIHILHIDDLDGAVTLFKSTDEGTETIAVFDEEHREVIQGLLVHRSMLHAEVKRLMDCLRYVGVCMYLEDNYHRACDHGDLLNYMMEITGEPDDLTGQMGAMIQEAIEE